MPASAIHPCARRSRASVLGQWVLVLVAFALTIAGPAIAKAPEPAAAPASPATDRSVLRAPDNPFDLTDEQRERIDQIVRDSGEHAERLKSDLADAQADLKRSLEAPEPDFDAVMREVDRVGRLETDLRKHQIATLMSLRALLSPDQREVLTKFLQAASEHEKRKAAAFEGVAPEAPERITSSGPAAAEAPTGP